MSLIVLEGLVRKKFPTARLQLVDEPGDSLLNNTTLPMPLGDLECMEVLMWDEGIVDRGDTVDDACEAVTEIIQDNSEWRVVGLETAGRKGLGFMLSRIYFVRGRFTAIDPDKLESWYSSTENDDFDFDDDDDDDDEQLPPWAQDAERWKRA